MVKDIIAILNERLSGLARESVVYGLAQSVLRVQGVEREVLPCVVLPDGEGLYVGIDDVNALMMYHKLSSATSTQVPNSGKGDNPGDLVNTYGMALVIVWDRKKLDMMQDEMMMLIQANIPVLISGIPDIKVTRVRVSGSQLDSLQVYTQEYQVENPKLPANILMMQVNYLIEITFNPACIKACP
jgi:hypothetical protein